MYPNPYNQQPQGPWGQQPQQPQPQQQWGQGGGAFGQVPVSGGYGGAAAVGAKVDPVAAFMTRVYTWMALGLGVTGATALIVQSQESLMELLFGTPLGFGLVGVSFLMAMGLSFFVHRMSPGAAMTLFFSYAAVLGAALSPIFWIYTSASIAATFFVTAGIFGALTVYGLVTKKDLSGWGTFLFMMVVGMLLASIVNIVVFGFASNMLYWGLTYAGVVLFSLLTAYDTNIIKQKAMESPEGMTPQSAIFGATLLYSDFLNLFLRLLRLLGSFRE